MQIIEIDLGGEVFSARMLIDRSPRTCEAIWESLPLDGLAVHARWSGNMVHIPGIEGLPVIEAENSIGFQYPGLVVYYPANNEIAVCYGDARFRGGARAEYVTPIAELVGDVGEFERVASVLHWSGETPAQFRRGTAVAEPEAAEKLEGARIVLNLDGSVVTAVLLEDSAPRTCAALRQLLPLEGQATNTKWSGEMAHFWGPDRASRGSIGLHVDPLENPTHFHWLGYLYYYPEWSGIRIPCGDAQMSGAFRTCEMTAFARFEGDWSSFREKASQLYRSGARPMSIRLRD